LVAAIAVEALGHENVTGVFMPTRYSSDHSREDAANWPRTWHPLLTVPIDDVFQPTWTHGGTFAGASRTCRGECPGANPGNILMALSNNSWLC